MQQQDKYRLFLSAGDWNEIIEFFKRRPQNLFHVPELRRMVAQRRAKAFGVWKEVDGSPDTSISYTIQHNKRQLNNFVEAHVTRLLLPLAVIDPVHSRAGELKVLSVGPRNEMELLHMLALGFQPQNIRAIDLITNSPLVEIGDMHDIPAENDAFDVTVAGWVLPYSREHQRAVDELIRVTKPGGLLALGLTRVPQEHPDHALLESEGGHSHQSTADLLALVGDRAGEVVFRHDPYDKTKKGAMLLIVRIAK